MAYTTIKKPSDYFNTKLYTGNGSTQSITGVGFQPDLTWLKNRSVAQNHELYDVVRGVTKAINSNTTSGETTYTNGLNAFGTDGFTVGDSAYINGSGNNIASWNWLASNTTASNTDGSITSTVSANTTSGFSIVSYTGNATVSTVGHGLGVAPKMIIIKNRSRTDAWPVDCRQVGGTLYLNETGTLQSYADASPFPSTAPTSTVFSIGTAGNANFSGSDLIAYCFAEKQGFSKFGSYTGNGSTDGTFIYTGFKPAWIMLKCSSSAGTNWFIQDNKRNPYNVVDKYLNADSSAVDSTADLFDITSSGFKQRNNFPNLNGSGQTYIYMAFAEEPLVGDNPATAR